MPPSARAFKDSTYEQFARIGRALSSPRRLELVDLLGQAPRTVESLASLTGMSVANTSQHLQVLRAAGLVDATKVGLYVTYQLAGDDLIRLFLSLRRVAEVHLEELQRVTGAFFASPDEPRPIEVPELIERTRRGEVALLDVRPANEYVLAHLPGAISVPLPELAARMTELPAGTDIVAYCRGPCCVLAVQAVRLLRAHGLHARRLEDGVREWAERGLPLEGAQHPPDAGERRVQGAWNVIAAG